MAYTINFYAGTKPTFTVENGEINGPTLNTNKLSIIEARTDKNCFYVYGNYTFRFTVGLSFSVISSAGNNNTYTVTSSQYVGVTAINLVTPVTPSIRIAGDFTDTFTAGRRFSITGSTNNDGRWIVASSTFSAPNTIITLSNSVPAGYKVGSTISGSGSAGSVKLALTAIKINGTPNVGANTTNDGTIQWTHPSPGVTIDLPGQGVSTWGEVINENLVHMLENFAGAGSPTSPTTGQLWYDTSTTTMKVWTGSVWTSVLSGSLGVTDLTVSSSFSSNGTTTIGDAAGDTFTVNPSAVTWTNNPTHSGNHTFSGNVTVNGNTQIGNAAGDTLTIFPSAVTWSSNPTHSGNHTFSGTFAVTGGNIGTGGTNNITFTTSGGTQVSVIHTASATRSVRLAGSNGGNPSIGTTAGMLSLNVGGTEVGQVTDNVNGFTSFYRKNAIINGEYNVWQDGILFTSVADATYTADRWLYRKVGAMVHDISRSTDVPTVAQAGRFFNYSYLVDCQTVDVSIAIGDYTKIVQRVEGYDWQPLAQIPVTMSFWVKSTKTGIFCVALQNSIADRSCVKEYTINSTNTWEFKTVTFPASPSAGTWDYINGIGVQLVFTLVAGVTFQGTANSYQSSDIFATSNQVNACDSTTNNFLLTGVQLEPGSVATPFEHMRTNHVLRLCKRFFQFWGGTSTTEMLPANGGTSSTSAAILNIGFQEEMRAAPTLSVSNVADWSLFTSAGTNSAATVISIAQSGTKSARLDVTGTGTPYTANQPAWVQANATANARLKLRAEL